MLRIPSAILAQANTTTRRQYACSVYWSLSQTDYKTRFFENAFVEQEHAKMYEDIVCSRLDAAIPIAEKEDFVLLPPLFLRSQENAIVYLSSSIVLVLCKDGPIFPVLLTPLPQSQPHTQQPKSPALSDAPTQEQQPCVAIHIQKDEEVKQQPTDVATVESLKQNEVETPVAAPDISSAHQTPRLSEQQELEYIKRLTKTPISCIPPTAHLSSLVPAQQQRRLSKEEKKELHEAQVFSCRQLKERLEALNKLKDEHEQQLANPNLQPSSRYITQASLVRKQEYIQTTLQKIRSERAMFIDALQGNVITRQFVLHERDADPEWYADSMEENVHLQTCIDLLEAASPHMMSI